MPNWVENHVTLDGDPERIHALLEAVKVDEFGLGTIDFNKVIPMPEALNIESGSRTETGFRAYKDFIYVYTLCGTINMDRLLDVPPKSEAVFLEKRSDIDPEIFELGKKAYQNLLLYGAKTWYEWCNNNWNTKWNACGYAPGIDYNDGNKLRFQTAWDAPIPIIEKISEMFPDVELVHEWANEDIGQGCGRMVYQGGVAVDEYYPEGREAVEYAASLWGFDPEPEDYEFQSMEDIT